MSNIIAVINGPNLNLLGKREKDIYGEKSLDEINRQIKLEAEKMKIEVEFFQSNLEGEIVNYLHSCRQRVKGVVLNPGAFTHYSIALRDAITAAEVDVVETHISNIFKRESFRHVSMLAPVCIGQVCGFGWYGYILALKAIVQHGREVIK